VNKEDREDIEKKMESYPDYPGHPDRGPLSKMVSNFPSEEAKALMTLSLSEFEAGTYVVKVRSALLGEDIYFVSSEKLFDKVPEGFVVYTAKELRALKGSTKDDIRNVHRIKKTFNGEIIP
jgi:hypothetical protein